MSNSKGSKEGSSPRSGAARSRAKRLADQYLVAADAQSTVRAYTADWTHFAQWCQARDVGSMPARPELVGEYLAELGEGYARATLRRKIAGIARAHRLAGHSLDTRHAAIRDVLRGIGRTHGDPPKRAQALALEEIQKLVAVCEDDIAGLRDRAMLLIGFAGALRRSEICGIEVGHLTWKPRAVELMIPRSKTDKEGEGSRLGIPIGRSAATCPVRALRAWLEAGGIEAGPVFRAVTRHGTLRSGALTGEAVRLILLKRARQAGIRATLLEPVSPHGLRAGFITSAYRSGVPDEEIMGHSRHRSLTTMRSYVRRSKLSHASPAGKVGL
ncbi:site-specific integrase (plasmid) [Roseomonas sp. OT10]|uniref:site-specific integrase n=1 Tax=Roseomonas cutis TaxID=2897332 RepID=UPI001E37B399|nr:site-specific integrase [Roseomonas sp. OT10]UFN51721.1 site-specific integrase [Roseomonas sp. OT10]